VGDLEVINAFLPMPASPSVAAVYLTVRNSGSSPDVLTEISTPDAQSSMLMTEAGSASTGTMQAQAELAIPGHGQATLTPGHDHAMLQNPTVTLKVGQRVPLTLHFAKAGALTIQIPVVPLTAITQSPSGSMGKMPGM
jgi:copper(I)-binding protein